jgi:hypothetical protein
VVKGIRLGTGLRGNGMGEIPGILMNSVRERENDYAAKKREERPREVLREENRCLSEQAKLSEQ